MRMFLVDATRDDNKVILGVHRLKSPFWATKCDTWWLMHLTPRTNLWEMLINTIRISNILTSHHLRIIIPSSLMVPPPPWRPVRKQRLGRFRHLLCRHRHGCCGGGGTWAVNQLFWLVVSLYHISPLEIIHFYPEREFQEWWRLPHTLWSNLSLGFQRKTPITKKWNNLLSVLSPSFSFRLFLATSKSDDPEM